MIDPNGPGLDAPRGAGQALADADLRRALVRAGIQRAVPPEPGQGPDRPVGGVRPAHPDRVRRRPRAGPRRGRPGRRPGRAPGRHAGPVRRHPARADEHLDDDQRHGHVAAGALPGRRRGAGRGHRQADRHHAERHHQGVPLPRHVHLPARALGAPDHRPDRLHRGPHAQVEPDQRVQLPPAGGRGHPGPGDRLRAVHRDRPSWTLSGTRGRSRRSGWARSSGGSPSS